MSDAKQSMAKINQMIGTIKKSKINQQIHECAIAIMRHAVEHGDHSAMTKLKRAIPASVRISDFNTWVIAHTPLNWDKNEAKYKKVKSESRTWQIEQADAIPFWVFTEDKPEIEKPIDAMAKLMAAVKSVQKSLEQGKEVKNLDKFNEIAAKISG